MKGNTILIVDDVEINREILALMFQQEYTILEAENGKEAIENMKNQMQSIAMVLLDLYMPQMN
ncbi:MAG: response regulator, partial [Lachnospiraceae bacterium]